MRKYKVQSHYTGRKSVTIPTEIVKELDIDEGDLANFELKDNKVIIIFEKVEKKWNNY